MYGPDIDPGNIRDEDLDEAARRGESMLAWLEEARTELEQVVGTGMAPSGQVRATVDANGRVLEVSYGPRAPRMDSVELAEETLAAVRAAGSDAERQTHDLLRAALPGYDPVAAGAELERLLNDELS
ncbi:YbaB/EbfC family nucleoid-associated protein [Nonomuraea sp. MG754425]|uniref:YbaB/EbfC family nucleoid-associated protein n=1 Tax=Nonomuraea sp. MG754425 TaxID=2570319 RepID=UPI001F22B153|nr:YbaB/EbfC family nucleoid-associated protein [Nonomuraea sp. MG754425]MCF6471087.1 YbaB/EbfC family nucleoid-associated protein [Nonomuraea sp. MG754425]